MPRSFATATFVRAKDGINVPARVASASDPSSTSCITAVLVSALVCDAIRKIVSVVMLPAGFLVGPAERLLVDDLAVLHHQRDDAGDLSVSTYRCSARSMIGARARHRT